MAKIKSKSLFLEDDLKNKNTKNDVPNNSAIMRDNTDDINAKSSKKNGERCNSRKSKCDKNSAEKHVKHSTGSRKTNGKSGSNSCVIKTNKRGNKKEEILVEPQKNQNVGRKDWAHNWFDGCDYVWVDGIDHWISKTAFKNEPGKTPIYTLDNYVQGLDSYWVLRYKSDIVNESTKKLSEANKSINKDYKSWTELSKDPTLTEQFVNAYAEYISILMFVNSCKKANRTLSQNFLKRHKDIIKFIYVI